MKKVVVIGGGTGTYTVLRGLKSYSVSLSAIVSMMDSGGSNRILRDEFGLLPTSDIRQCMIALADETQNEILRNLFTYRFSSGVGIAGMTFGNLFMAALTDLYESQEEALKKTCKLLNIKGKIIPVTYDNVHLIARYENGREVLGEHFIDEPGVSYGRIVEFSTVPHAQASPAAVAAIEKADVIVLGPGDLFTSTIADLVVGGIRDAIMHSHAKIVYIVNLMTKLGQTDQFTAQDHVDAIEKYVGRPVDVILVNEPIELADELKARYKDERAEVVKNNLLSRPNQIIIEGDFISDSIFEKSKADKLVRSLVRHDSEKLAHAIIAACKTVSSAK